MKTAHGMCDSYGKKLKESLYTSLLIALVARSRSHMLLWERPSRLTDCVCVCSRALPNWLRIAQLPHLRQIRSADHATAFSHESHTHRTHYHPYAYEPPPSPPNHHYPPQQHVTLIAQKDNCAHPMSISGKQPPSFIAHAFPFKTAARHGRTTPVASPWPPPPLPPPPPKAPFGDSSAEPVMRRRIEGDTPRPGEFVSVPAAGDAWVTTPFALLLTIAPAPAPTAAPAPALRRPLTARGARPRPRGADAASGGLPLPADFPPPLTPTTPEALAAAAATDVAGAGTGAGRWEPGARGWRPLATGCRGVPFGAPGGGIAPPAAPLETFPPTCWDPGGAGTGVGAAAVVVVELPVLLRLRLPGGGCEVLVEDSACCRQRRRERGEEREYIYMSSSGRSFRGRKKDSRATRLEGGRRVFGQSGVRFELREGTRTVRRLHCALVQYVRLTDRIISDKTGPSQHIGSGRI